MPWKTKKKPTKKETFAEIVASAENGKKLKIPCTPGQVHWKELREFFERHCFQCKRTFQNSGGEDHAASAHHNAVCPSCNQTVASNSGGVHVNVLPDEWLEEFYQAIGHEA